MTDYYVRPTNGSNANSGTSFANAWQTTQYALDNVAADDSIFLCAEATETITAQIDVDTVNGSNEAPVRIEGRDGTDGSTRATYTIQAVATWGGGAVVARTNLFGKAHIYSDIVFDANGLATNGFDDNYANTVKDEDQHGFIRCRFTGGTGDGFASEHPSYTHFVECEFDNNTSAGFRPTTFNDGMIKAYFCRFHDNGSHGCVADVEFPAFNHCEFYDNGGDGLFLQARSDTHQTINCTAYGNTDSGFYINSSSVNPSVLINNSSSGNGAYGFEFGAAGDIDTIMYMDYNHTHNNTSGTTNLTGGMPGANNQTGDPLFASVVDGSEDFTPGNGSPLDGNGLFGVDIGARKAADPAGGGGVRVITKLVPI